MRILRIVLGVLLALGLAAFGGWTWLTAAEPVPETTDYRIDLDEIRELAASIPGPRPSRVNAERVAVGSLPRGGIFAGEPFEPYPISHVVYQLSGPDGFVLIDAAFGPEMQPDSDFDADAFARVLDAMARADALVVTHEHADHIGGLAHVEDPAALAGRLLLTREQQANTEQLDDAGLPGALRELPALDYERLHALAPGVVLLKAPGHTPGSQMIYVGLDDGRELLFLGDVAWHGDQIRNLHYRPRLVTDFFLGEDREAVLDQFRALHDLRESAPAVTQVVSHDLDQLTALHESGAMGRQLELPVR